MAQVLNSENIPPVVKASATSLTLAATYLGQSTRINIGGQQATHYTNLQPLEASLNMKKGSRLGWAY